VEKLSNTNAEAASLNMIEPNHVLLEHNSEWKMCLITVVILVIVGVSLQESVKEQNSNSYSPNADLPARDWLIIRNVPSETSRQSARCRQI